LCNNQATEAATVLRPYCDQSFDQIALDQSYSTQQFVQFIGYNYVVTYDGIGYTTGSASNNTARQHYCYALQSAVL